MYEGKAHEKNEKTDCFYAAKELQIYIAEQKQQEKEKKRLAKTFPCRR